jgi:hypothetical protein
MLYVDLFRPSTNSTMTIKVPDELSWDVGEKDILNKIFAANQWVIDSFNAQFIPAKYFILPENVIDMEL